MASSTDLVTLSDTKIKLVRPANVHIGLVHKQAPPSPPPLDALPPKIALVQPTRLQDDFDSLRRLYRPMEAIPA